MRGTDWMRIVLCGFVARRRLISRLSGLPGVPGTGLRHLRTTRRTVCRLGRGVLLRGRCGDGHLGGVWLYSAIAPRYGAKPATAALVGVAWWTIKSLQSAKWAGLGFVQLDGLIGLALASLVAAVVASLVGAGLYDKVARPANREPATT